MCSCLCDSTVFYKNGVILQKRHLVDYAVLQLLDRTQKKFETNNFTLNIFIDLYKVLPIADNKIILKETGVVSSIWMLTRLKVT